MIEFFTDWAIAVFTMVMDSGPYLLLGLVIAGLLKALLPGADVVKHMGKDDLRSVAIATAVGAPLPLCSCSVIPTAVELRKKGASKGATTAFLISTPETGVDSIGVTWALIDPVMTFARPISALLTAFGAGAIVNALNRRGWLPGGETVGVVPPCADSCEAPATHASPIAHDHVGAADHATSHDSHDHSHGDPHPHAHSSHSNGDHGHSHASALGDDATPRVRRSPWALLVEAVRYGFGPMLADLTPWFLIGFILSGLITVALPDGFFGDTIPVGMTAMFLMLLIAPAMYICATASTPVAAALIAKGLDPGAALVLMLAGPATSAATMLIVNRLLGRRAMIVYVGTIVVGAFLAGTAVNQIYAVLDIDLRSVVSSGDALEAGFFTYLCGGLLLLGIVGHAWQGSMVRRFEEWLASIGAVRNARVARVAWVSVVVVSWLSSGYSVVLPGETGFVLRFGRVVEEVAGPAQVFHAPYPISSVDLVSTSFIHRVKVGMDEESDLRPLAAMGDPESDGDEIECVTSDEKLLLVSYSVHFRISDAHRVRFEIRDVSELVLNASAAALRRTVGRHKMDEHLVERREPLEEETRGYLNEMLVSMDAGVDVVDVNFDYIHAPARVHFAYRDVASALEDKETSVKEGQIYEIEQMSFARTDESRILQEVEGDRAKMLAAAVSVFARFRALATLSSEYGPAIRNQLYFESARRTYRDLRFIGRVAPNVLIRPIYKTKPGTSEGESGHSAAATEDG